MTALVIQGRADSLPLPDQSVDLIVTSPPYFAMRSYEDGGSHYVGQIGSEATPQEFLAALLTCTREWARVIKPSGSIWVNLGDKYVSSGGHADDASTSRLEGRPNLRNQGRADRSTLGNGIRGKSLMGLPWRYAIGCIDQLGLILREEIIWLKTNPQPESVKDRAARSHEQWFHFTVNPRYYAAMDGIREPHRSKEDPRPLGRANKTPRHLIATDNTGWKRHLVRHHTQGKLPGSVWAIATRSFKPPAALAVKHHAAFPAEWPRRLITAWCPPDGVVLDPMGGSGTTALVASVLGRTGITVDLSHDYSRLARWRTTDPSQRSRISPAATSQPSLDFGGAA